MKMFNFDRTSADEIALYILLSFTLCLTLTFMFAWIGEKVKPVSDWLSKIIEKRGK
jgi:hypothetical protein